MLQLPALEYHVSQPTLEKKNAVPHRHQSNKFKNEKHYELTNYRHKKLTHCEERGNVWGEGFASGAYACIAGCIALHCRFHQVAIDHVSPRDGAERGQGGLLKNTTISTCFRLPFPLLCLSLLTEKVRCCENLSVLNLEKTASTSSRPNASKLPYWQHHTTREGCRGRHGEDERESGTGG